MPSSRYREIVVAGPPREMGRQIGESARDEVRGFCDVALERVNKTATVSMQHAMSVAEKAISIVADYRPDLLEELRGTAEAAGVSLDKLMLLQVRNQLTSDASPDAGCTSLAISADAAVDGCGMVAQNWDNDPALDEFTIVLTRRPRDQPAHLALTQAGLIAYIGLNDCGVGVCLNTLPAPARDRGVPHYFILREVLEASSLNEVIEAVERAERAIPANLMLITPEGPADLEVTLDGVRVLRADKSGRIAHTNHCLHGDLLAINDRFPELIDSHPRKRRIDNLLATGADSIGCDDVQRWLADHDDHPRSICRHENDHPEHGFWTTVYSVVMRPSALQMKVARGNPCQNAFEVYQL